MEAHTVEGVGLYMKVCVRVGLKLRVCLIVVAESMCFIMVGIVRLPYWNCFHV